MTWLSDKGTVLDSEVQMYDVQSITEELLVNSHYHLPLYKIDSYNI